MIKVVRCDKVNESESFDRHITTVTFELKESNNLLKRLY